MLYNHLIIIIIILKINILIMKKHDKNKYLHNAPFNDNKISRRMIIPNKFSKI